MGINYSMSEIGLIKFSEIPAFLKKNNITGTEANQVTKLLTEANANKSGKSDDFVTDSEVLSYIQNQKAPIISADLSGKVLKALNEWDSIAAKEFQTKLQTPKEMSVTSFTGGRLVGSLDNAKGTVTLGKDQYQFSLYDANDLDSKSGMKLTLTDSQGNRIILGQDNIPESFVKAVEDGKPPKSGSVRYSSIFNSRFCSVEE